jgi:hypothetical protein
MNATQTAAPSHPAPATELAGADPYARMRAADRGRAKECARLEVEAELAALEAETLDLAARGDLAAAEKALGALEASLLGATLRGLLYGGAQ